jgi:hypothetical protein
VEVYLNSPNTPLWRGAQLKHRDNFTFTLERIFPSKMRTNKGKMEGTEGKKLRKTKKKKSVCF